MGAAPLDGLDTGVRVDIFQPSEDRPVLGLTLDGGADRHEDPGPGRHDYVLIVGVPDGGPGVSLREHRGCAARQNVGVGVHAVLPVCRRGVRVHVDEARQHNTAGEGERLARRLGDGCPGGDYAAIADGDGAGTV